MLVYVKLCYVRWFSTATGTCVFRRYLQRPFSQISVVSFYPVRVLTVRGFSWGRRLSAVPSAAFFSDKCSIMRSCSCYDSRSVKYVAYEERENVRLSYVRLSYVRLS